MPFMCALITAFSKCFMQVAAKIPSGHRRNIFQARFMPESGNGRVSESLCGILINGTPQLTKY